MKRFAAAALPTRRPSWFRRGSAPGSRFGCLASEGGDQSLEPGLQIEGRCREIHLPAPSDTRPPRAVRYAAGEDVSPCLRRRARGLTPGPRYAARLAGRSPTHAGPTPTLHASMPGPAEHARGSPPIVTHSGPQYAAAPSRSRSTRSTADTPGSPSYARCPTSGSRWSAIPLAPVGRRYAGALVDAAPPTSAAIRRDPRSCAWGSDGAPTPGRRVLSALASRPPLAAPPAEGSRLRHGQYRPARLSSGQRNDFPKRNSRRIPKGPRRQDFFSGRLAGAGRARESAPGILTNR